MALTASPHSALPSGPSWDETIVPSLRKRLETESRILTKRLSTISIADDGSAQGTNRTTSPPQDSIDTYPLRPSAIPRPSYSSRSEATPSEPARKAEPPKRQRTQSTPFPFDNSLQSPPNGLANGVPISPTTSTTASISPRMQSPSGARATPSRIPTVSSRARSGSQSSQSVGVKATLPPSHKFPEVPPLENHGRASPSESFYTKASSSNLARQRIVDERPPFTNEPPPNVLEQEFMHRPSAEEERTYQHWYRGDVSRNGGVGEFRVGKREEMLDIANFGHALRGPIGRTRAYEEPISASRGLGNGTRKRTGSVSSPERTSIYMEHDGITSRVLDEAPLTDMEDEETDFERDQHSHSHGQPSNFGMQRSHQPQQQNGITQGSPTNHNRRRGVDTTTLPTRLPSAKPQARTPQPQVHLKSPKAVTREIPATSSEPSTPGKPNPRDRGRPKAANEKSTKTNGQKRSKSAADALRSTSEKHESVDYTGLADAVPETRSPIPRDGNWDEVILPTVARRMGIEYEKEDPLTAAKKNPRESRVAPAPGTFGYDHTKYKPPRSDEDIPMGEFGQQYLDSAVEDKESSQAPEEEPVYTTLRSRRDTMPTPAPFSHYLAASPEPDFMDRGRRTERQDVPKILVSSPTMEPRSIRVEEGENSGCCKCVVM